MAEVFGRAGGSIEVKRFYLHGVEIKDVCPKCGKEVVRELGDHYLSYPMMNEPIPYSIFCGTDGCDGEWDVPIILRLSVELADEPKTVC